MYKWQPPEEESDKDLRIEDNQVKDDAVPYVVEESFNVDVDIDSVDKRPKNALAKTFHELVGQGLKPHEAAKRLGHTMKGLMSNESFTKQVQSLIDTATLPPDVRKAMIRSGLNAIFMQNINQPDKESQKLAIEAAKVIGSDPDVGLNAQPQAGIQINLNTLSSVLDKLPETIDIKKEE